MGVDYIYLVGEIVGAGVISVTDGVAACCVFYLVVVVVVVGGVVISCTGCTVGYVITVGWGVVISYYWVYVFGLVMTV